MAAFGKLGWVLSGAVAMLVAAAVPAGAAQSYFCQSLSADYLAMDRAAGGQSGGGDLRQQLAAAQAAVRRAGCSRFLFFGPKPGKQCPQLLTRVDQLQGALMRSAGSFGIFGPQNAARERDRLRTTLLAYGCDVPLGGGYGYGDAYRTICVRACDGYYFTISSNGNRGRFKVDQAVCQSMYPQGTAEIYVYRYPSDDVSQATSLSGQQYGRQSFAFTYRSTYDATCADTFAGPNPKVVGSTKPPATPAIIAAYALPLKGRAKSDAEMPDAAADELPPDESVPDDSSVVAVTDPDAEKTPVRTIGPSYYYKSSYYASSSGPPPKVAGYKPPVLGDRQVAVRELPPNAPVAASILPDPLSVIGGR